MTRYRKRGFTLLTVIVLLSMAMITETLVVRYLADLRQHVQLRRRIVAQRVQAFNRPQSDMEKVTDAFKYPAAAFRDAGVGR